MVFHDPKTRQVKDLMPGVHARSFWGENLMLMVVDLDAQAFIPTHSHPAEQGGIVLEGQVDFVIAGESKKLQTGDIYMIPGGVEHSVQVGPAPARVLDVFHPVRDELKY
jgi:quercetin dioxygenase-like cupin family protein